MDNDYALEAFGTTVHSGDKDETFDELGKIMPRTRSELCFYSQQGQFSIKWFRLRQSLNFELNRILSIQLGSMVYMYEKNCVTDFHPKFNINLSPYCNLEVLLGLNTQGLGLTRNFTQKFATSVFLGKNRGKWEMEAEAVYKLSQDKHFYIRSCSLGYGLLAYKQKLSRGMTKLYVRNSFSESVVGFECKVKVDSDLSVFAGVEKAVSELDSIHKWSFGLQMAFGQYLRLGHFIETFANCVYWKFRVKRGTFCLDIPVKLTRLPGLLTCFGVCALTYLSKEAYKLLFTQKNTEKKDQKKFSQEFLAMAEHKIRKNMEDEDNKGGLVVLQALYGNLKKIHQYLETGKEDDEFIDVTLALNFLVDESKLSIPKQSKEGLQGFWWVCDDACLYVYYKNRGETFKVTLKNEESLVIG